MPPPMTSSRFGIWRSSSAEVESHDARIVERNAGNLDDPRAGGEDRLVEADRAHAGAASTASTFGEETSGTLRPP